MSLHKIITVSGDRELEGEIFISGSKNSAGPLIGAAALLESATLENIPRISDVFSVISILQGVGMDISFEGNTLHMKWGDSIDNSQLDGELMKKARIGLLLIPALLERGRSVQFPFPGGCNLGKRPIGEHLDGLHTLGYSLETKDDCFVLSGSKQSGDIHLHANSMVTATSNMLIASVLRKGTTYIHSAAYEPSVITLVHFLQQHGSKIHLGYDHTIQIEGIDSLPKKAFFVNDYDYLESGTYIVAAALASKKYLDIHHACISDHTRFLGLLSKMGISYEILPQDTLRVFRAQKLSPCNLQTNIFPGISSDLQSPVGVLMTQADGMSKIHEVLYENRFSYLYELEKMKAHVAVLNPHESLVFGKTRLRGSEVASWDLRAGAAMVLAGLIADGNTIITNVDYIERGYENLIQKLQGVGANISLIG